MPKNLAENPGAIEDLPSKLRRCDAFGTMSRVLVVPLVGLLAACQASVQADARMSTDAEVDVSDDERVETKERLVALETQTSSAPPRVLLGARRDLTLKSTVDAVSCRCVKVVLGPATAAQFAWQDERPPTLPDTQLVLAFEPEEGCSGGPPDSNGASYWGYRIEGDDVIVLLEPLVKGPPRTVGAVLPRPPNDGQVYVAPVKAGLPYGLPLSGNGTRCALGNPGPKRTTPFTAAETGN